MNLLSVYAALVANLFDEPPYPIVRGDLEYLGPNA